MPRASKKRSPERVSAAQNCTALAGGLTIYQANQIKALLLEALFAARAQRTALRLDMSAVTECDASGLQMLVSLALAARAAQTNVELLATPESIAATFERYGVDNYFTTATAGVVQ